MCMCVCIDRWKVCGFEGDLGGFCHVKRGHVVYSLCYVI
jgi:hypothetical protein